MTSRAPHGVAASMLAVLICGLLVPRSVASTDDVAESLDPQQSQAFLHRRNNGMPSSPRRRQLDALEDTDPVQPCQCDTKDKKNDAQLLPLPVSLPVIVVLVMFSGLFSGLTLGLMGLDDIGLQIVANGGNAEMAACAARIAPVRKKGNQLLCTLLLGNVAVNSALSILTAELASGLVGFLVSTALIVIFGEILPQAACSRYALQVGSLTVPVVKFLMLLFYIITKPLSIMLDCLLGREVGTVFSRDELMEMLKLQIKLGAVDETEGEFAKQVAEGAICFRDKIVDQVMTPLERTYMLSTEKKLGYETIREIFENGMSRVPVYGKDKHDYRGLLYAKDLMLADPEDEMKLGDFIEIFQRKVESFYKTDKLVDVLNKFKKGGTHMGLVTEMNKEDPKHPQFKILGVLTLEDVMEEILQDEIVDETDVYVEMDTHVKVAREERNLNLGVFNPIWTTLRERLSREEVGAISTHLGRELFFEGSDMQLSRSAIEWLVCISTVESRNRTTPLGVEVPHEADEVYLYGRESTICTLVLQGRLTVRAGCDGFRTEAGAFTILGGDALRGGRPFTPDFAAFVSTIEVRLLSITKAHYLEARNLDQDPTLLEQAMASLAAESKGEASRKEAKELSRHHRTRSSSPSRLCRGATASPHPSTSPRPHTVLPL